VSYPFFAAARMRARLSNIALDGGSWDNRSVGRAAAIGSAERARGSSASRRASPTTWYAATVAKRRRPGNARSHHAAG
jgi:hypothetical protein